MIAVAENAYAELGGHLARLVRRLALPDQPALISQQPQRADHAPFQRQPLVRRERIGADHGETDRPGVAALDMRAPLVEVARAAVHAGGVDHAVIAARLDQ